MYRILTVIACSVALQACVSNEQIATESMNTEMNKQPTDYRNLRSYPGNVTCGEYLEIGFYSSKYIDFVVVDGKAYNRPNRLDLAVFCSEDPISSLNQELGIDYQAQKDSIKAVRDAFALIEPALLAFEKDAKRFPSTEQGLKALSEPALYGPLYTPFPEDGYLTTVPLDPWGNAFDYYLSPMGGIRILYDLQSFGADGVPGGEGENADIKSTYERYFKHIDNL